MEQEFLRTETSRLMRSENLKDELESYKYVTDAALAISKSHVGKTFDSVAQLDSFYLFQMTALKNLSMFKLMESLNYSNDLVDWKMLNIFDPTVMLNIVRNQYEAFCCFNNMFLGSSSEEEIKLKYNFWVVSGLNYRQDFGAEQSENSRKKFNEANQINEIIKEIEESNIFTNLNPNTQLKLRHMLSKRKWQLYVNGNTAGYIGWSQMFRNAGVSGVFDNEYNYLSLQTHPSNVSVFQYRDRYFEKQDLPLGQLAMMVSRSLICFFIRDYCYYYKDAKKTFDSLPIMHQIIINFENKMHRGEEYKINNITNILG
jgi:hypothetical protein